MMNTDTRLIENMLEYAIEVNMFFDKRLLTLKTLMNSSEYAQREEELSYIRKEVNKLMQMYLA